MTTISIAMCTYNSETYLQEQLDSVANQTRLPNELIICDDCSTDRTEDIVRAFENVAPFKVNFSTNEKQLGSTANFERAIRMCQGDIIVLADHDDICYPHQLARIDEAFAKDSTFPDMVFCDADLMDVEGKLLNARMWEYFGFGQRLQSRIKHGEAFDVFLRKHIVPGCTLAFRQKYRSLIVPFPDVGIHDRWIALLIAAVGCVHAIPEPLIRYRKHSTQQAGVALTSITTAFRKNAVSEQIERAHRPAASIYADLANLYETAITRLSETSDYHVNKQVLLKLREKVLHLNARSTLPRSLWRRIPIVLSELVKLHYFRYSNGIYSLARDIIIGK